MTNKTFFRALCAIAMTCGLGGTALAQMEEPQAPQNPPSPQTPEPTQPSTGYHETPDSGMSDPGATLEMAREHLQGNETSTAASEMREVATSMRADARSAPSEAGKKLTDAAKKLDKAAGQLESGTNMQPQNVDMTLAGAANALAKYNHAEARAAMQSNDNERFSKHLKAGARDLERAATWSGRETERGVRDVIGDAVELSGKVSEGAGAIPKDAGRVVEAMGRGIDRVGKDIHGAKPAKPAKQAARG